MTNTPTNLDELRAALATYTAHEWELFIRTRSRTVGTLLVALPALIEELDEARKEIERLRGFEPCRATMGAGTEHWFCGIERRSHAGAMDNYKRHKSASKSVHDFLSGAFDDATTEGK